MRLREYGQHQGKERALHAAIPSDGGTLAESVPGGGRLSFDQIREPEGGVRGHPGRLVVELLRNLEATTAVFQTGLGAPARVLQPRPGDLHPGEHLELTRFLRDALRRSDLVPRLREASQEHEGLRADVESARSRAVADELLAQHVVRSDFLQDPRRPLERRPALARVEMPIRWERPNRRAQCRIAALSRQECGLLAIASVVSTGTRDAEAHEAVPADQQRQRGTITETLHEGTPLGERGRGLLFAAAHPPAEREDLVARL